MKRRAFLAAAGIAALSGVAIAARRSDAKVLRIGVMTNLTHAPLLAGLGSGRIAKSLAPAVIEARAFRAGPRVCEALLGEAIDVGTTGPAAAVIHHARHGRSLRVVMGCASGGASLVTTRRSGIAAATDLRGKRIAVTALGTTQDVALRTYLRAHNLRDRAAGGDVTILAIAAATILEQLKKGDLDAAWLAEPWATRVVRELDAHRFLDERDLWPERRFATALLVTRGTLAADPRIVTLRDALEAEVALARSDPERAREESYRELARHVGNPGKRNVFDAAWKLVDFTRDPLQASVARFADNAFALGLCPPHAAGGLFA